MTHEHQNPTEQGLSEREEIARLFDPFAGSAMSKLRDHVPPPGSFDATLLPYWEQKWAEALAKADDALAIIARRSTPADTARAGEVLDEPWITQRVKELVEEGDGHWRSCSGCHETEDGHEVGQYPYSAALGCKLGGGCSECGGLGAIWDNIDYAAMADEIAREEGWLSDAPADTARAGEGRTMVDHFNDGTVPALSAAPIPGEGGEEGSSSASLPAHVASATATEAQHSDGAER